MLRLLFKYADLFVHKDVHSQESRTLFKARIFVLVLYFLFFVFTINIVYAVVGEGHDINSMFEISYVICIIAFLVLFKTLGKINLFVHLLSGVCVALLAAQVHERGGIYSSDLFWVSTIVVWSCYITSIKEAAIWLVIVLLIYFAFYYFAGSFINSQSEFNLGPAYALINLCFVSVALFIFVALYEFQINSLFKQLQASNAVIQQKNKGIENSISYAKKIQEGSLPSVKVFEQYFSECFILFRPKDVIGGDFYNIYFKSGYTIVVCADCTGHGVPGAMLSTFGLTSLNEIIYSQNITDPGEIVHELADKLKALFQNDKSDIKDGMDICVITINQLTNELSFFGAGNGMLMKRNGEFHDFKKQFYGIGGNYKIDKLKRLPNQIIDLRKGDQIYMYTDGITDQFGGIQNKKLSKKGMIALYKKLDDVELSKKSEILNEKINDWIGHQKQTDDILILGLKV
jgi:serine phosphatase RsbU (regulator of sigma subunit)